MNKRQIQIGAYNIRKRTSVIKEDREKKRRKSPQSQKLLCKTKEEFRVREAGVWELGWRLGFSFSIKNHVRETPLR